ncbi:hypothetical protein SAMD00019534_030420 [Acytostelium subglobosum LB1]|uniref:hypothetical protein n=1 Tax=Acytostelium subglobosum LB1 TaxID=1410327 RepID=UPI0006449C83|nr:hypothetical protein SAMD00019534_030420 [Acytostelium subglobosum LB1]GAM19867.1 hypothetical protein SAMD00019534_030420 [Acytostelium subglobosum LB1]|eukprot:XP_012756629.1 hypothetical protein SAMD00019534_030420 [Acytostelium subglobosum LB1]
MVNFFASSKWRLSLCLVCKMFARRVAKHHLCMLNGQMFSRPGMGQHLDSPHFPYRFATGLNAQLEHMDDLITNYEAQPQQLAVMLSRITRLDVFSIGPAPITEYETEVTTLFDVVNNTLRKLTLRSPEDTDESLPTLLEYINRNQYPQLSIISIHFLDHIQGHDHILSMLEHTAPTLTKVSLFSTFNTRHIEMEVSNECKETTTKFFERFFGILSNAPSHIHSLHIKKLYLGDLRPFLQGLSTMQHIKKLKLFTFPFYSSTKMAEFNAGLIDYVKSRDIRILSTPFPVSADLLATIFAKPSIFQLRMSPLVMSKVPSTLSNLSLRNEIPPAAFTSFITLNPTSNLVRLFLFDHRHYLTADNFDQFLDFVCTSKSLSSIFFGDYLFLTDDQKSKLIPVLVRDTNLHSILIGITDPDDVELDLEQNDILESRTAKELPDTGDFVGQYQKHSWSYNFHRIIKGSH